MKLTSYTDKLIGKIYNFLLEKCQHPKAIWLLAFISFIESSMFITPPELMLLPMSYANRKKAFFYAGVTTIFSVIGAVAGYYIGALLWDSCSEYAFKFIPGLAANFDKVGDLYKENVVMALFLAAFTPIPYKVFTIAAGVYSAKISIWPVIFTGFIGRGSRYYILAAIVYIFGERSKELIEKHFTLFTVIVGLLAVLGVLAINYM